MVKPSCLKDSVKDLKFQFVSIWGLGSFNVTMIIFLNMPDEIFLFHDLCMICVTLNDGLVCLM